MSVLIINTDGAMRRVELPASEDNQYRLLRKAVGGDIEGVYPPVDGVHGYIHGEGKFVHGRNEIATRLMSERMMPGDFIAGPMILLADGPDGTEADLTDAQAAELMQLIEPVEPVPEWHGSHEFAEVAEAIGVPTSVIVAWGKNILPTVRPGVDAVMWTEGNEIWTCAVMRNEDGILCRLPNTLKRQGTLDELIERIEGETR